MKSSLPSPSKPPTVTCTKNYDGDSTITAYLCLPPVDPHVDRPLRMKKLFHVSLAPPTTSPAADGATSNNVVSSVSPVAECVCDNDIASTTNRAVHGCRVEMKGTDGFSCECEDIQQHENERSAEQGMYEWMMEDTGEANLDAAMDLVALKYTILRKLKCCYEYKRLVLPPPLDGVPIQPGLFKGNYGAHGVEIVLLSYAEDRSQLRCCKISGDPNIPAGQLTVRADLSRPMVLTRQQQESVGTLQQIDIPDLPPNTAHHQLPSQPFCIPHDCWERFPNPPKTCRARYHSQGQIAGHNYTGSSYIPGHLVVFDNNTFGHLWLELRSFSMYSRVTEKL